jgi:hypothetical protein
MLSYFVRHSLPVNHLYFHARILLNYIYIGLIVVFKGQTTLSWGSYIVALFMGAFITVTIFRKAKKKQLFIFLHAICVAFLVHPLCTHRQRNQFDPNDEDGSKRY